MRLCYWHLEYRGAGVDFDRLAIDGNWQGQYQSTMHVARCVPHRRSPVRVLFIGRLACNERRAAAHNS